MHSVWDQQCEELARWWLHHAQDHEQGGFYGEVAYNNQPNLQASKCIILHSRILWFFSAAAKTYANAQYAEAAQRAYHYLRVFFYDHAQGGFYWSVAANGEALDCRKHIYAQAFCIYALAAYYDFSGEAAALELAGETFALIETNARDATHGGYYESFSAAWQKNEDVRLSAKEDNHPKTMNTHLHLLEAYTGLLNSLNGCQRPSATVRAALVHVLDIYCQRIIDFDGERIRMFLSEDWVDRSHDASFGHDIESSWLLYKAMSALATHTAEKYRKYADCLAEGALRRGLNASGRMRDEQNLSTGHLAHTAWWVQFEAMVGFAYRWQQTSDKRYLAAVSSIWRYTQAQYRDSTYGEWHWFAKDDLEFAASEYKIGAWKAPYHNGRAFLELSKLGIVVATD